MLLFQLIAYKMISIGVNLVSEYFSTHFMINITIPPFSFKISIWQSKLCLENLNLIHYYSPC